MSKIVLPAGPTKIIRVDRAALAKNRVDKGRRPQWIVSVREPEGNIRVVKGHWLSAINVMGSRPDDAGVFLSTDAEITVFTEDDEDG